jgi:hypothetical protein
MRRMCIGGVGVGGLPWGLVAIPQVTEVWDDVQDVCDHALYPAIQQHRTAHYRAKQGKAAADR